MQKTRLAIFGMAALGLCLIGPRDASAFPAADSSGKIYAQTGTGKSASIPVRWAGHAGGFGHAGFGRGIGGWRGGVGFGRGFGWRGAGWRGGWRRGYYGGAGYGWGWPLGFGVGLGIGATGWGYPGYGGYGYSGGCGCGGW